MTTYLVADRVGSSGRAPLSLLRRLDRDRDIMMAIAFHRKHLHIVANHRFWLIVSAVLAFLLAALWAQPVH